MANSYRTSDLARQSGAQGVQTRLRLFCFAYAGGSARIFRSWSDALPAEVEVCPVELPGRGSRMTVPLCARMPALLDDLTPFIMRCRDQPMVFFGHSLGALISFELARRLQRSFQIEPAGLLVSGYAAPHLPRRSPPMHLLDHDQFLARLREYNGTPEEVLQDEEVMDIMTPILRADFAVAETYAYAKGAPLSCPVTAFGGLQDKDVTLRELEAWRMHTTRDFRARVFPGQHFFLQTSEELFLPALGRELQRLLAERSGRLTPV